MRFYELLFLFFIIILFNGCDKEVSRSPVETESPKGFIYISSIPSGFTIFQNGRNTGRLTPDSISYISDGVYAITLKKKYYKDTTLVVTLNEDEKLNLDFDIQSNPSMYGNIYLQTVPAGASIILNDSVTGKKTPFTFSNLLPGEYKVNFTLLNHRDTEIIAIVQSSKTNSYNEELRDTSVWVDYQLFNSEIQSNSLTAIAIDDNNVKWIGSIDKGLIRFDDISFTNFNTTNSSILSNRINCIAIHQNKIWIGTDFGIGIFDGIGWIKYNRSNSGLTSEIINTIRFDNLSNAWIGTSGNLVQFDGTNWTIYNQTVGKDWINDINIESSDKLYLGTKQDGIFVFENQNFTWLSFFDYGYLSTTISSIECDQSNNIWFCFLPDTSGRGGVSIWDGMIFTNLLLGSPQNNVNDVFIDDQNYKWFATTEGLVCYDPQNNSILFNTLNSLISSNNVRASSMDSNGVLWITTIGGGLNKYKFNH